jgi:heme o synthase
MAINLKMQVFKKYYYLVKPGIIRGNLLMVAAGYLFASAFNISISNLLGVLTGTALIIGASCVVNNYIDRNIDKKMERTKKRALVQGTISPLSAFSYAAILAIAGTLALYFFTNLRTLAAGWLGVFFYVVVYSIFKRKSVHGTLIGSISGALPPVAGYVAFTNRFDLGALLLFLIMVAWQMTHFYAIATYRQADYKAAGIPVLPVVEGMKETKEQMLVYCILFIVATSMLTYYGYTGYVYLVVTVLLGLWWLWACVLGFQAKDDIAWGKSIFKKSLVILLVLSVMISIGPILP